MASANGNGGRRCVSVNDIRRAFEKAEQSLQQAAAKGYSGMSPCHNRMSSLDSTNSDESSIPTPQHCYGSVSSLISGQTNMRDHYGSISSLASSTSLISPQVRIFENIKRRLCIPTCYVDRLDIIFCTTFNTFIRFFGCCYVCLVTNN